MAYIDELSEEDTVSLELILNEKVLIGIRNGKVTQSEYDAVVMVDKIIQEAPPIGGDLIIYKNIQGMPELRDGGELSEPFFLFGMSTKPETVQDASVILAITIPKGSNILELPGNMFVYHRGRKLELEPSDSGLVATIIVGEMEEEALFTEEKPFSTEITGTITLTSIDYLETGTITLVPKEFEA